MFQICMKYSSFYRICSQFHFTISLWPGMIFTQFYNSILSIICPKIFWGAGTFSYNGQCCSKRIGCYCPLLHFMVVFNIENLQVQKSKINELIIIINYLIKYLLRRAWNKLLNTPGTGDQLFKQDRSLYR